MPLTENLSINANSTRADILSKVEPEDFAWAVPIMRAGYAGRGLVYLVVAIVSLWSMWQGGEAQGTKEAMLALDGIWGMLVVALVAAGMFAYAIWRLVDSFWDLEAYGTELKGIIARCGMVVTGLAHAGVGVLAITALGLRSSSASGTGKILSAVLQAPGGNVALGLAGLLTMGAGCYYIHQGAAQTYREHLSANHFTMNWNWALRAGVVAQGIIVFIIGGLILYAAMKSDPSQVGGLGTVFEWLREQPYGQILVAGLCVGLLGFSLFCFVNAANRIIPKAADDSTLTMTAALKRKMAEI